MPQKHSVKVSKWPTHLWAVTKLAKATSWAAGGQVNRNLSPKEKKALESYLKQQRAKSPGLFDEK